MSAIVKSSGGGLTSSDVKATRADVLAGKTALTSDSNDEPAVGTLAVGNVLQASKSTSGYASIQYSSVIDAGADNTKAVFVAHSHTGGAKEGKVEASNNNSSWTEISSGFYTYRYYRAKVQGESGTSAQSYAYVGVINLGYVRP